VARPIVITGGGTGGHVFPMQAVAEQLRADGVLPGRLRFVGSRRGQERRLLGDGPVALTLLPGRGLQRSFAPRALVENVVAVAQLATAWLAALYLVGRWRPSVVVSLGGYAALPVGAAAVLWRRPLVLVELDATPGATHRLLGRFAARRCTAFSTPDPRAVVTGVPLRDAILAVDRSPSARAAQRDELTPPIDSSRLVVVVMTGSLGARRVNDAVLELATRWASRRDRAIIHVTGRRDADRVRRARPTTAGLDYRIVDFAEMAPLWQLCDAAVTRAGATTIAELTALGVPAVLVPLPHAPGDHQTENARQLVEAGAAEWVADDQCTGERLDAALERLLTTEENERVGASARRLGRRDGAAAIAREVLAIAGAR
jgi:UDP-N-acetylglucosamine--N-acetylmuramyl-(pentapeptide) pyrophosphoryl-undecaprenol N-acetylglucosamine transferase